jgi:hydroxylamine reductase
VIARARRNRAAPAYALKKSTVGFHYSVALGLADKIVEAVKAGQIRRFFVIGGCDGAEPGRNYFADFAQGRPPDT